MEGFLNFFSKDYQKLDRRKESYNFIESFIEKNVESWDSPPKTEIIAKQFLDEISKISKNDFAFLVCHTGYIPEDYAPDSSQETLYSKLVEAVVCEWARRIGFTKSSLPTQKSSTEDVTISDGELWIVCDAKSFRLGRSQGAPNVKDVLKHADISKWLKKYPEDSRVGGIVTFPSQHDWSSGSDFYQYTTDKDLPTMCLYYEHMAFLILSEIGKAEIINTFQRYGEIFPKILLKNQQNRDAYYAGIEAALFGEKIASWREFEALAMLVTSECALHTYDVLKARVDFIHAEVAEGFENIKDIEVLRGMAIEAESKRRTDGLCKQMDRIKKFRNLLDEYFD
ncbi:HindIII family type II restriction endonuclease [Novosphingobium humi]|uniref:HindIII family type II restriction endonuclease n=1 Tax=Novosphingobium humi TaxID=2282397 RepID=UPI0025B2435F|nr:HindIII family type II restriction endonuclease [Novosphingobium humi]WJT00125.1 HindIII family type II restriction endonuclease [Novosphingobium humi]